MRNRLACALLAAALAAFSPVLAPAAPAAPGDPQSVPAGPPVVGDPGRYAEPETDADGPATRPAGTAGIAALPSQTMNYQGYVTDNFGAPLNGGHSVTVRLWNAAAAGAVVFGPENFPVVAMTNGLFNLAIGSTLTLDPALFDQALWIEIAVDATTLPRQPLRPVAYANSLVPGAVIDGDPPGSTTGLTVRNLGAGEDAMALSGGRYGLYVAEDGAGDEAIYSVDYINSLGYRSRADSYVWVPGIAGVVVTPTALDINPSGSNPGRANLGTPLAAGVTTNYLIPITIPSVLLGQGVTVEELTVYYQVSNAASFITGTALHKLSSASGVAALIDDPTDRASTTDASYSLAPAGDNVLTAASGPLTVVLSLDFATTSQYIRVAGVRLRLGHVPTP